MCAGQLEWSNDSGNYRIRIAGYKLKVKPYEKRERDILISFFRSYTYPYQRILFFPGPLAFCKKAVERVSREKNILNSSVEWSGFF